MRAMWTTGPAFVVPCESSQVLDGHTHCVRDEIVLATSVERDLQVGIGDKADRGRRTGGSQLHWQ